MICLILLIGFFLRVINLNQSLWLDEAISALAVKNNSLSQLLFSFMPGDVHPPLHYIMLWFWGRIFGFSEISLRIPSVLFGVGSIYLVYLISKILFKKKVGILAALIFCFNPLVVYYSQEARMYSLDVFLICLSFLFFNLFLQRKKYSLIGLIFTNLLLLYSDYVLFTVLVAQILYLICFEKSRFKLYFVTLILSFLGFVFWIPIFFTQLGFGKESVTTLSKWAEVVGGLSAKNIALIFIKIVLGRISFDNKIIYFFLSGGSFLIYLYLGYLGVRKSQKENSLILLWLFIPIMLLSLISLFLPILAYHRLIFIIPALSILIAKGVYVLSKKWRPLVLSVVLSISILSLFIYYFDQRFQREDWKNAVKFIVDIKPNVVLFEDNNLIAPVNYYTSNTSNLIPGLRKIPAIADSDLVDLDLLLKTNTTTYVVEYLVDITDPKRLLQKKLEKMGFVAGKIYNFNGVGFITLYTR